MVKDHTKLTLKLKENLTLITPKCNLTFIYVSIPKSVLMSFQVIRLYDIKNTLSFPSEETSLGHGGFPHISPREMYHAHPSLLTVFSITQSDHSITPLSIPYVTD
jgi:hypothetical protein